MCILQKGLHLACLERRQQIHEIIVISLVNSFVLFLFFHFNDSFFCIITYFSFIHFVIEIHSHDICIYSTNNGNWLCWYYKIDQVLQKAR